MSRLALGRFKHAPGQTSFPTCTGVLASYTFPTCTGVPASYTHQHCSYYYYRFTAIIQDNPHQPAHTVKNWRIL